MLKNNIKNLFLFVLALIALSSVFVIQQKDRAVVLRFGKIMRVYNNPGLNFKLPFFENVTFVSKRLQGYVMPLLEVNDVKQKKIVVDVYVRYLISDPALYLKNIGNNDFSFSSKAMSRTMLDDRLSRYVSSSVRNIIGRYSISDLLSEKREIIMMEITKNVLARAREVGLQVKDVRIVNFSLPAENLNNVFKRMESDRYREAKRLRADGQRTATEIIAKADKDKLIILAKANNSSKKIRGEAEFEVSKIFSAFNNKEDIDLYIYLRQIDAYRRAFINNTKHVMSKSVIVKSIENKKSIE